MKLSIDVATFIGRLPIGKQGENLTTQVVFDCANWLGELTGGTLSIVHQRPTDTDGYPCANYETTDTTLTWDVNETDLAFCGTGQLELRYTIGDRIAKSRTFITQILKALTPMETPPEAYEPYIDRVIDAATREMENMTATAEAHESSTTLPSATIEVTRVDDDHTNLHFIFNLVKGMGVDIHSANVYEDATKPSPFVEVVPYAATPAMELVDINFYNIKGADGQDGLPGMTPSFSIGTVTTGEPGTPASAEVTGTDANPVLNLTIPQGADGDATIDDAAGSGDLTDTWSADRLDEITGYKKGSIAASSFSSGKYINFNSCGVGSNWTNCISTGTGGYTASAIDVSAFKGGSMTLTGNNIGATSARAFGFCDANNIVSSVYAEMLIPYDATLGKYSITIPIDNDYFFYSANTFNQSVSITMKKKNFCNAAEVKNVIYNDTVYVSPTGDDTASGTASNPLATLQKAVNTGASLIKVYPGTYAPFQIFRRKHPLTIMLANMPAYSTSQLVLPKIVVSDPTKNYGILVQDSTEVRLFDIEVQNVKAHLFQIQDVDYIECNRCIAHDNSAASSCGFKITNANGIFRDCIAYNVILDGFNIHGYGNTEFINCKAYSCGDDGISHHDGTTGLINGGEFYSCGKGGVASPTYGSNVDICNVYIHDNVYGIYAVAGSDHPEGCKTNISNCASKNNSSYDIFLSNTQANGWNNIYDTKTLISGATFTELT